MCYMSILSAYYELKMAHYLSKKNPYWNFWCFWDNSNFYVCYFSIDAWSSKKGCTYCTQASYSATLKVSTISLFHRMKFKHLLLGFQSPPCQNKQSIMNWTSSSSASSSNNHQHTAEQKNGHLPFIEPQDIHRPPLSSELNSLAVRHFLVIHDWD